MSVSEDFNAKLGRILEQNQHLYELGDDLGPYQAEDYPLDQGTESDFKFETNYANLGSPRIGNDSAKDDRVVLRLIDTDDLDEFRDDRLRTDSLQYGLTSDDIHSSKPKQKLQSLKPRGIFRKKKISDLAEGKDQLWRTFNSPIKRSDVVNSYVRDGVDGTFIGPEMHNSSKLSMFRNHIGINSSSREDNSRQVREQRREIKLLSRTVQELKSKSVSLDKSGLYSDDRNSANPYSKLLHLSTFTQTQKASLTIPLPVSEREKFSFLQKRILQLESENKELREHNRLLNERIRSQNEALKTGIDTKALSLKNKALLSVQDGITQEVTKQYSMLSANLARIKSRVFKHITEPNFIDCLNFVLKDTCKILGFEQYSFVLKHGEDTLLDKVVEEWQIPERKQPPKLYKFQTQGHHVAQREVLIQRQGPGNLEIESEVDNQVKKIVLNALAEFREVKIDKQVLNVWFLTPRNYIYLPLLITLRGSKRSINIGLAVFKFSPSSTHPSVMPVSTPVFHNFKKLSLLELVSYVGIVFEMYLQQRRASLMEEMFQSFASSIPYYLDSLEISTLMIKLKLTLTKFLKCEDFAVLVKDEKEDCLLGLNSSFGVKDYTDIEQKELQRFPTKEGITGSVLSSKKAVFTDNPYNNSLYSQGVDCLSPVYALKNLMILPISTRKSPDIGVVHIINQSSPLDPSDYRDISSKVCNTIAYIVETCQEGIKSYNLAKQIDKSVEMMRKIMQDS